ncbi:MAG: PD40 domain-containing protein [Rhodospirillales bacterium]|nr:PD40 domain-containing protein [Rhodospirillales bacterium]
MASITRVSTDADGLEANDRSLTPSISADGHYVAFASIAGNLVPGDGAGTWDIFVKDTQTGSTIAVSTDANGVLGNNQSYAPSISADGRYVSFASYADNLVASDVNHELDIFIKDLHTGTISLVNTAADGTQANSYGILSSISADGTFVAFESLASNLVAGDTNGVYDVFVKNVETGEITLVSTASDGTLGRAASKNPSLSADGRYVAFSSDANNLVAHDTNGRTDVFVKDLQTGEVTLVSAAADGTLGNSFSTDASISADGRYVAFSSNASNLVAGDTNGTYDVFVKDLATGNIVRASIAPDGSEGTFAALFPSISADGHYVAFESSSNTLVAGDVNGVSDIFVKNLLTGTIFYADTTADGSTGDSTGTSAAMAADGHHVAFESWASDLVSDDANSRQDVFVADVAGTFVRSLIGSEWNDTLQGTRFGETIRGLGGDDLLLGNDGIDSLNGGDGRDRLFAGAGADLLDGHFGNDRLHGGNGNDRLIGDAGNDTLIGGLGQDTLTGGLGRDCFVFRPGNSVFDHGDVVTDFTTGQDRLDLRAVGVDTFIGTAGFIAGDGVIEVRVGARGELQADLNDDGAFDAGDLQILGINNVHVVDILLA